MTLMCLAFTYIKHPLYSGLWQLHVQLLEQFQTFLVVQAAILVNISLLELLSSERLLKCFGLLRIVRHLF